MISDVKRERYLLISSGCDHRLDVNPEDGSDGLSTYACCLI